MKKVAVIMGSDSDLPILRKTMDTLTSLGIPYECHIYSAHRTPVQAAEFSRTAQEKGFGAIIAAAGKAVTPGGAVEICRILGRDETLRRLRAGLEKLA